MATLYLAKRFGAAGFQRNVAIKVLKDRLARDQSFIEMFVDEATIASRISHPNVVKIDELGEENGRYYLVMEHVHGVAMSEFLMLLARNHRRLTPAAAVEIVCQASAGLHAAHETRGQDGQNLNVIHRDVSPQNILLGITGDVKIIDFGIAKARDRLHQTDVGAGLKGKLRYMAPEQLTGHREIDRRVDVFALGVVLWEMLTMRRLHQGLGDAAVIKKAVEAKFPPPGAFADIPYGLDAAIMRALSKEPENRPANAREFVKELRKAVPESRDVDTVELAALMWAVAGDVLEERAKATGATPAMNTAEMSTMPSKALLELTVANEDPFEDAPTTVSSAPFSMDEFELPNVSNLKSTGPMMVTPQVANLLPAAKSPPPASAPPRPFSPPVPEPQRAIPEAIRNVTPGGSGAPNMSGARLRPPPQAPPAFASPQPAPRLPHSPQSTYVSGPPPRSKTKTALLVALVVVLCLGVLIGAYAITKALQ